MDEDTATPLLSAATVPALEAVRGLVHGFEQKGAAPEGESRDETRARMASALAHLGQLHVMRQVHGRVVHRAPWDGLPEGDGGIAEERGLILGIETADCQSVLLVDPRRRVVGAAHAGWRGTAQGVVRAAVERLLAGGSRAEDLLAALGPSIGPCCYEVGEELRAEFGPSGGDFFRAGPRGRPHLDVRAANARQLEEAGITPSRIHHVADCTRCRGDLYPSYRRDGLAAGRMISFIGFAREP